MESFVKEYLRPITRWPRNPKIIHDPLWGTVRLNTWEVALLDMPLFQRLRQIRQTSLAYLVFPGCSHTRFEHTLGVVHQAQRLIDAVNCQSKQKAFTADVVRDLRLAALFHDVGHCCFSHISEQVYRHCPDMQAAIGEGGPYEECHPHEVMSALILSSKGIRRLIEKLEDHYGIQLNPERAARWIVGRLENDDERLRYRTEVVNGPFDADKLDYIFRDAHYSGLPVALDLDRLWARCQVNRFKAEGVVSRRLTLDRNSVAPLEQILFAKMTLFSVVYQHPKVRAAEMMFYGALEHLTGKSALNKATDFLRMTDDRFFALALSRRADDVVHMKIHDIQYRRLFYRALTLSGDTLRKGPAQAWLRRVTNESRMLPGKRFARDLARKIWVHAGKPCRESEVWLDLPPAPKTGEADRTYLRLPSGKYAKLSDIFPVGYWNEMYMDHRWRGHVFCPVHCQQKVYLAAMAVLKKEMGSAPKRLAGQLSHVEKP